MYWPTAPRCEEEYAEREGTGCRFKGVFAKEEHIFLNYNRPIGAVKMYIYLQLSNKYYLSNSQHLVILSELFNYELTFERNQF